jgi:protein FRA10AC1
MRFSHSHPFAPPTDISFHQFALRWRTESEVLSGAGERSCANTRCALHPPPRADEALAAIPGLATLELPFAYAERGQARQALVKTVLCPRCVRKLMWRKEREREERARRERELEKVEAGPAPPEAVAAAAAAGEEGGARRRRSSRSRSPRRREKDERPRRRRSP